jgi:hypothetical protein
MITTNKGYMERGREGREQVCVCEREREKATISLDNNKKKKKRTKGEESQGVERQGGGRDLREHILLICISG